MVSVLAFYNDRGNSLIEGVDWETPQDSVCSEWVWLGYGLRGRSDLWWVYIAILDRLLISALLMFSVLLQPFVRQYADTIESILTGEE